MFTTSISGLSIGCLRRHVTIVSVFLHDFQLQKLVGCLVGMSRKIPIST